MKIFKVCLIAASFGLFILACSENKPENTAATNGVVKNADQPANSPAASTPANETAEAQKIYTQSCANCHKEDGTGGKKEIDGKTINVDNLTTAKMAAMADEKYFDYIKNGVPDEGMPAFKNQLSDEQIRSVIKFIRTNLQKK